MVVSIWTIPPYRETVVVGSLLDLFLVDDARHLATWHEYTPFWPKRLTNGRYSFPGPQVWRRKLPNGDWEYRQDAYTLEDWLNDQW